VFYPKCINLLKENGVDEAMIKNIEKIKQSELFDKIGAAGSSLCLVHCVISAFLPSIFIALGMGSVLSGSYEWIFTIAAICIAAIALWLSFRKHRSKFILFSFCLGISALLASRLIESSGGGHHHQDHDHTAAQILQDQHHVSGLDLHIIGALVGIGGGLILLGSHLYSIRLSRRSRNCG